MSNLDDVLPRSSNDEVSAGGAAIEHPARLTPAFVVAPDAEGQEKNTFRLGLIPIACWRLDDVRFHIDQSFIRPETRRELALLRALVQENQDAPLSVFGHADPSGPDEDNKRLSGRRASAIYALLTRKVPMWEALFETPFWSDNWGLRGLQVMLQAIGQEPGSADGVDGPRTQAAVRAFQSANGLAPTGSTDKATRAKLFSAYMDFLCGAAFSIDPTSFLAGGADPKGKGDFQGCGEFNAILRESRAQRVAFAKSENKSDRDVFHAPNRRVVIFMFRPGTVVTPESWPCPRVNEGTAACQKRFFSDHDLRRAPGLDSRKYDDNRDTFACRFYDRFSRESPCEAPSKNPLIEVRVGIDTAFCIAEEGDRYTLRSVDGSYDKTLNCGAGILEGGRVILVFKRVLASKNYDLIRELGGDVRYAVFRDVAVSVITDFGVPNPKTPPRTGSAPKPPPEHVPQSGDPQFTQLPQGALASTTLEDAPTAPPRNLIT